MVKMIYVLKFGHYRGGSLDKTLVKSSRFHWNHFSSNSAMECITQQQQENQQLKSNNLKASTEQQQASLQGHFLKKKIGKGKKRSKRELLSSAQVGGDGKTWPCGIYRDKEAVADGTSWPERLEWTTRDVGCEPSRTQGGGASLALCFTFCFASFFLHERFVLFSLIWFIGYAVQRRMGGRM